MIGDKKTKTETTMAKFNGKVKYWLDIREPQKP